MVTSPKKLVCRSYRSVLKKHLRCYVLSVFVPHWCAPHHRSEEGGWESMKRLREGNGAEKGGTIGEGAV